MNRRKIFLLVATLTAMIAIAALSAAKKPRLLLLEWAAKGDKDKPPVAILVELGTADKEPADWSGRAAVTGAKVVHREGYRFRAADKLVAPDGWKASSHRAQRAPARRPLINRREGISTVGIVLHLTDVTDEATLTLEAGKEGKKTSVPLKDVLAGKRRPVWDGAAVVRLVTTTTPLATGPTEDDFPTAAYGPDGTLWVAYISYRLKEESRRVESKQLKEQPADFKAFHTPEFGDQLFVKYLRGGKWSAPLAITGPNEDLMRCAIAVERDGTAWVAYSANRKGNYRVYVRPIRPEVKDATGVPRVGAEQLRGSYERALNPVMSTGSSGELILGYPIRDAGHRAALIVCRNGKWGGVLEVPQPPIKADFKHLWTMELATGPNGNIAVAHDRYRQGDYDVEVALLGAKAPEVLKIAASARFEARPSLCYDAKGRLWIAYEEGPEDWGKDYGAFAPDKGHPLYDSRSVRVICLVDGKLFRPVAELPTSVVKAPTAGDALTTQRFESRTRYSNPRLGLDGKGRLWLTYRQKFGSRYTTVPGSYWLTFARRLDGDHWTDPIEVHHSDGMLDNRSALLPHAAGGFVFIHNGDGRYTQPTTLHNHVYVSYLDLPGDVIEPKLVPHEPGVKKGAGGKAEAEAVKRIRAYRLALGGKKLQLLRGDFHRHTEISWDGGPDGSLEDMFRYALDAAAMDWIGNGDHDNGAGREYTWWLIQKLSDAYHVKDRFTPMFTYERSVSYPHGHRNCMFAKRGVRTLPRLAQPDPKKRVAGVHADDTKMLYRYLRELDGICASHTSATGMGTDWRDHDPKVEPFVEVYQGDRMSYEVEDAPRTGYSPKSGKKPVNIAGWYPEGYINNAFAKGYRMAFESSSDHWSTHMSYCIVLAEAHDRASILKALKQRHCYGATDNIILDVRSGDHLMGDAFKADGAPALQFRVIGTGPLDRIDILRDSEVVHTLRPDGRDYVGKWTDPKPPAGTHYYYVRVRQKNGELAWGSPLWFER